MFGGNVSLGFVRPTSCDNRRKMKQNRRTLKAEDSSCVNLLQPVKILLIQKFNGNVFFSLYRAAETAELSELMQTKLEKNHFYLVGLGLLVRLRGYSHNLVATKARSSCMIVNNCVCSTI